MDNYNDISPQGYQSPLIPLQSQTQQKADEKDREETLAQIPLLKKVVKRLDARISATDSISEAIVAAQKYQISREEALVAFSIVKQQLEAERSFIQARIDRLR